jgi:hypothetical protein
MTMSSGGGDGLSPAPNTGARSLYISIPWASPFEGVEGVVPRGSDWAVHGWRQIPHRLREAWRIHRAARDVMVLNASMEIYFLCLFSLLSKRRLVAYDFLRPRARWAVPVGRLLLRRVDRWLVVRSSDIGMLGSDFRVPADRCEFVPYPGTPAGGATELGGYVYAAGIVHRDWPTLIAAARLCDVPFIISSDPQLTDVPANVDARPLVSPADGRRLAAGAQLVVVPLVDTSLPAGPTVVVDAQAAGKAVIATDTGGARDYVDNGRTGWLVPPGDAPAMARVISEVFDDEELLERVGRTAAAEMPSPRACLDIACEAAFRNPGERSA